MSAHLQLPVAQLRCATKDAHRLAFLQLTIPASMQHPVVGQRSITCSTTMPCKKCDGPRLLAGSKAGTWGAAAATQQHSLDLEAHHHLALQRLQARHQAAARGAAVAPHDAGKGAAGEHQGGVPLVRPHLVHIHCRQRGPA